MNNIEEKYNLYDRIISATYANIAITSQGFDITLEGFNFKSPTCRVFLEAAIMVSTVEGKDIYLHTSFFHFLAARLKYKNKHIHWIRKSKTPTQPVDILRLADYEATAFKQSPHIFIDIYKAYYERKK